MHTSTREPNAIDHSGWATASTRARGLTGLVVIAMAAWIAGGAPAWADDDAPIRGPAEAETALQSLLEELVLRCPDRETQRTRLRERGARATGAGAGRLRESLALVGAVLEQQPPPERLPQDAGMLFVIARRLPVPTPDTWLGVLRAELGRGDARDVALIEWISRAPGGAALLRELVRDGEELRLEAAALAACLHHLGIRGGLDDGPALFRARARREAEVSHYAVSGLDELLQRAARRRLGAPIADLHQELFETFSLNTWSPLEGAQALIREREDPDRALGLLDETLRRTEARIDTSSIGSFVEATLGRAWESALGGDLDAAIDLAGAASKLPREILEREDTVRVATLQAVLVRELFRAMRGDEVADALREALEAHPSLVEFNPLDSAWWARFGPAGMSGPVRRSGLADPWRRAIETLLEAIEAGGAHTGHGLIGRPDDQEERPVSWIFLTVAQLQLEDAGDPELALSTLRERIPALEGMLGWRNKNLLARARLMEARVHLHRAEGADAFAAAAAARLVAEGLASSLIESSLDRLAQNQLPLDPPGRTLWSAHGFYSPLLGRAHRVQANLEATLDADPSAAARALWRAGEHLDWDGDRWMSTALDFARRGFPELTRRALACVEPYPDRLYDRACVAAHLGQDDVCVDLLYEHLRQRTYTEAGAVLERAYLARDPDLDAVRGHARFPGSR